MNRRNSYTGVICTILVIVAMAAGIFIGYQMGKTKGSQVNSGTQSQPQTLDAAAESVSETLDGSSESEKGAVVITVNGRSVSMEEINYYLYQQRDYFVNLYGEEPWNVTMDDGKTVAEYAKEQLYEEIIRTQILNEKAAEYNIVMTDEMNAQLADNAQDYVNHLGTDICEQFGLNTTAIVKVYQDGELSNETYNAIRDQLSEQMKMDDDYSGLSDEEFESAVNEAYNVLFQEWRDNADIQTTQLWDSIVIGAVG